MISNMEALTDRLERFEIENRARERMPPPLAPPMLINHNDNQDEGDGSDDLDDDQVTLLGEPRRVGHGVVRRRGRGRAYQNIQRRAQQEASQFECNMRAIKFKIPKFFRKTDPKEYIKWEKEVENVFPCHNFTDEQKVRFYVSKLKDYAQTWWDKLMSRRRRNLEAPIDSWYEFKESMRKRFVPNHFQRDMAQELQALRQGSKSVERLLQRDGHFDGST
ncbi:uncharacterized protein E5676_scaffold447G001250 [Cucumis melo var. makuwa]|nr:uncharacterized protein E5676_scaffold447G001250 [Cucumis melo var. makuwa]